MLVGWFEYKNVTVCVPPDSFLKVCQAETKKGQNIRR